MIVMIILVENMANKILELVITASKCFHGLVFFDSFMR